MNNIDPEAKLAAYRAAKVKQERIDNFKEKLRNFFTFPKPRTDVRPEKEELLEQNDDIDTKELTKEVSENSVNNSTNIRRRGKQVFLFVVWVTLYVIFIKLEFGIIYLIVSGLFGMYYNTRTGPRDESEVSAYSVFNRNCESIDGTLKAEQFEREIRYGPHSVH